MFPVYLFSAEIYSSRSPLQGGESAIGSDILHQALLNSGLTETSAAGGGVVLRGLDPGGGGEGGGGLADALVAKLGGAAVGDVLSRLDGLGVIATMTVRDSATGSVKRHVIRKVSAGRRRQGAPTTAGETYVDNMYQFI